MNDCNIITTNPRNYYLEVLFQKNIEIFYEEDQGLSDEMDKGKKYVKLPLHCEVVFYEPEY